MVVVVVCGGGGLLTMLIRFYKAEMCVTFGFPLPPGHCVKEKATITR